MNIELSTMPATTLLKVLDLQIHARRNTGKSLLFFQLLFQENHPGSELVIPPLSWFDAHQLHQFLQQLATGHSVKLSVLDLQDAHIQLTGSFCRLAGRLTEERTIRVAPLGRVVDPFTPFTVYASAADLKSYAHKLHQRLWESFIKG